MTPQARGNLVVNNKVNSPQQQIILPTSPLLNGNSLQNGMNGSNAGIVNGVNACGSGGEQISSLYHINGQQSFLGPFKVYSKYFKSTFLIPLLAEQRNDLYVQLCIPACERYFPPCSVRVTPKHLKKETKNGEEKWENIVANGFRSLVSNKWRIIDTYRDAVVRLCRLLAMAMQLLFTLLHFPFSGR